MRWLDESMRLARVGHEFLAIVGSVMQQDVRRRALSGLGWIAGAAVVWLVWFRRERVEAS